MANSIRDLADSFLSGDTEGVPDIVTFVEAKWGLNFTLFPVQKFILKCLYGLPLDDGEATIRVPTVVNDRILYEFSEVDFLKWLHEEGRCNTDVVEGKEFRELVLVAGRRGTKSTLSACISNYEIFKLIKYGDPCEYYGFPPDTLFSIVNVAPTDDQASVVFDMIKSMAMNCKYLHNRTLHQTLHYFDVMTDRDLKANSGKHRMKDKRASIISLAGGCSSNSLRGRNAIVVIMDEMAFFIDNNGRFSGTEVYKALTPSTASFKRDGKIITISSPYAKYGAFYNRYRQSFQQQETVLMFKLYSCLVNPTIDSFVLKDERRRDRVTFMCEYGGEFSDSIVAWVEGEDELEKCVDDDLKQKTRGEGDVDYFVGIDLGMKNDGTAVAIVHREDDQIVLDYANVWFSGLSDVWEDANSIYSRCDRYRTMDNLRMSDVADEIAQLCRWFPVRKGIFDQHNGYSLLEMLRNKGLEQFEMKHFTDRTGSDMYQLARALMLDGILRLPRHPVLVPELLSLEAEKKISKGKSGDPFSGGGKSERGGKIEVRAPNTPGAHDDISDAYVRAVWLCHECGMSEEGKGRRAALAGGGVVVAGGPRGSVVDARRFALEKRKMHGPHPRTGDTKKTRNHASMAAQHAQRIRRG